MCVGFAAEIGSRLVRHGDFKAAVKDAFLGGIRRHCHLIAWTISRKTVPGKVGAGIFTFSAVAYNSSRVIIRYGPLWDGFRRVFLETIDDFVVNEREYSFDYESIKNFLDGRFCRFCRIDLEQLRSRKSSRIVKVVKRWFSGN